MNVQTQSFRPVTNFGIWQLSIKLSVLAGVLMAFSYGVLFVAKSVAGLF